MAVNIRTDLLQSLPPQQRNAALIERHQANAPLRREATETWPATRTARPSAPPVAERHPRPGTIEDLRDQSDTEMALVWQYAELERQRAENAAILDAANEAMVLISPDHRLVSANRRFCHLLGVKRDRLLGLHVHQIRPVLLTVFGSDDLCALMRWSPGSPLPEPVQVNQVYPSQRTHEVIVSDVHGHDTGDLGRLFSLRDITSQLELDRMKDDFIATVTHELRTPMTSIAGFLDLLLRGSAGEIPGQARSFLEIAQRNVGSLIEQVNELLEFSRLEAGACPMEITPVDLRSALTEAVATVSPMIEERHQRLAIDLAAGLPAVSADRGRLIQVLVNLISNANRYTLEGGSIAVHACMDGPGMRVDVADTGIGLSPREQELIFTRFYRVHQDPNAAIGSGLGLPIAKALVERMGGRIWVRSAPSRGSIFSFTIPIHR